MTNTTEPDRLTNPRAAEDWALEVLAADDDLRVHSDLPGWIEVALRCAPECCPNQSDPGPAWEQVEQTPMGPWPAGIRPAQCGACGRNGGNWATTGTHELTDDEHQDAARLRKRVEDLHLERRDRNATQ